MTEIAVRDSLRDSLRLFDWMPRLFDFDFDMPQMRVEEYVEDGNLVLKAEMPGIDPDKDVKISCNEGWLRIQAERKESSEHKDKEGYRSEFKYGSFTRDVPLPNGAKRTDIKASYKDGVLMVKVPMPEEVQSVSNIPITHD